VLFSGSIEENIIYGLDLANMTDMEKENILDEACR